MGAVDQEGRLGMLRAGYDAWNARDVEAGVNFFAADAEWWGPPHSPFAGPYRGHGEIRRFFTSILEMFDELVREPITFEEAGDRVLVEVRSYARGRGSGASIDVVLYDLWTFRGDAVARYQVFEDRHDAAAALRAD